MLIHLLSVLEGVLIQGNMVPLGEVLEDQTKIVRLSDENGFKISLHKYDAVGAGFHCETIQEREGCGYIPLHAFPSLV